MHMKNADTLFSIFSPPFPKEKRISLAKFFARERAAKQQFPLRELRILARSAFCFMGKTFFYFAFTHERNTVFPVKQKRLIHKNLPADKSRCFKQNQANRQAMNVDSVTPEAPTTPLCLCICNLFHCQHITLLSHKKQVLYIFLIFTHN